MFFFFCILLLLLLFILHSSTRLLPSLVRICMTDGHNFVCSCDYFVIRCAEIGPNFFFTVFFFFCGICMHSTEPEKWMFFKFTFRGKLFHRFKWEIVWLYFLSRMLLLLLHCHDFTFNHIRSDCNFCGISVAIRSI